ncbi:hypothetical protein Sango_0016200 [Sesamum angolense]|uniref:Uncharacterized protein n=1 Tax=Sesamum angolense TaxID=2727404 RepID=A0AAE1XCJ3_9LAMI|nr:hypothetical protein Sango_0016200 [Sesamum angolense]
MEENLEIVLGVMDLDLALREDTLPALTNKSTSEQKRRKKGGRNLTVCVIIMKKSIPEAIRGTTSETLTKAKDFLEYIEKSRGLDCSNSQKWIDAMNEEIKFMKDNDVWELVQLPQGAKPIG